MSAPTEPAPEVPVTRSGILGPDGIRGRSRGLRRIHGSGVVGVIDFGGKWYADSDPGWFGGHWWWVAVTAAAGGVVGLLRRLTRLPEQVPGLFEDLKSEHVDPGLVPGIAAVSAVSLIGGASLGPEKALGAMGGGAGTWVARRRALGQEDSQANTLVGFTGAYGGLFSSTVIVVMLILEAARPGGQRFFKALVGGVVASSVSFGIYFAIAGAVFLDAYQVPPYSFEDWQLLAGIPLGLFAALLVTLLVAFMRMASRLFGRLKLPGIVKSTLGGVVFGRVGVALPLTMFSGSDQLKTVLKDAGTLGWACSSRSSSRSCSLRRQPGQRVRGGPFPSLFTEGRAGVLVHEGSPACHWMAFSCLLAAVPGSVAPRLLDGADTAFLTQWERSSRTILIAVITAFLTMEGVKYLVTVRKQSREAAASQTASPNGPNTEG